MKHKRRILVVDDDLDIAITYKIGLEASGYQVDIYTNPEKALEGFREYYYDLLLIDIRMPKISGFKLYTQLRKKDKEFKICFITAFDVYYQSLREFYAKLDVQCFIKKPIDIHQLRNHVDRELENRK